MSKPRLIVGYVGCYLCHLAILELRIFEFNVEANMVTYWFVDEHGVK